MSITWKVTRCLNCFACTLTYIVPIVQSGLASRIWIIDLLKLTLLRTPILLAMLLKRTLPSTYHGIKDLQLDNKSIIEGIVGSFWSGGRGGLGLISFSHHHHPSLLCLLAMFLFSHYAAENSDHFRRAFEENCYLFKFV